MIAKFDENSYIDTDSITFVNGEYTSGNELEWKTIVVVGGERLTIFGQPGKNILESFLWKHKHATYNMIPGSADYRKQK